MSPPSAPPPYNLLVACCSLWPTQQCCQGGGGKPLSAPQGAETFDVRGTSGLKVYVVYSPTLVTAPGGAGRWPLHSDVEVTVALNGPSSTVNDNKVSGRRRDTRKRGQRLALWAISLEADTSRNGVVESNTKWTWGPNGEGAILLVNCDRDGPSSGNMDNAYPYTFIQDVQHRETVLYLQDLSLVLLNTHGPAGVFSTHKLVLHTSVFDAGKVRVFHANGDSPPSNYEHVLGSDKLSYVVRSTDGRAQHTFYVEGLAFPDAGFKGLVSLHATLLDQSSQNLPATPVFTDTVVFRVAPWIMTPNTMKPLELFVLTVKSKQSVRQSYRIHFYILPFSWNGNADAMDFHQQDEIEFGYVQAPHKSFPVVFDSPRNRGLKEFPFKKILGPDFGYVTREPRDGYVSGLDSFGNLDVSPPVTVKGKQYPLGRILIGSSFPGSGNRRMAKVVRDFLYAQKVQPPVELYSDWLTVGHVDEFLTFVPAPNRKGFRLLLASPSACLKLFKEKQREGYGDAALFEGESGPVFSLPSQPANTILHGDSKYVQSCIDWNRNILKRELGLSERDIIDIPQLFTLEGSTAMALFPDMVNMLVLGKHLGIPKPFGPIIHGECCLESQVRSLLEPLGLTCDFIDDFFSYHVLSGEVHCGTNVCRERFSFPWWNMIP
uniref:protein-arginine deiminase n=1 Tax=Varanus komodoensis TaxID=61221 RepID=A0A8D2LD32_VARKO